MNKHKRTGIIVLIVVVICFIGIYSYSRRWRKFSDNNYVGNQELNAVGFVTDYDPGLAVGDTVEIKQDQDRRRLEVYEGKATIVGVTKNADQNFVFVTDKEFAGSTPKIGGSWRKLNII